MSDAAGLHRRRRRAASATARAERRSSRSARVWVKPAGMCWATTTPAAKPAGRCREHLRQRARPAGGGADDHQLVGRRRRRGGGGRGRGGGRLRRPPRGGLHRGAPRPRAPSRAARAPARGCPSPCPALVLSRKSTAPSSSARRVVCAPSRVRVLSISTLVGASAMMRRSASSPSISGMLTSRMTTSGRRLRGERAPPPRRRLPCPRSAPASGARACARPPGARRPSRPRSGRRMLSAILRLGLAGRRWPPAAARRQAAWRRGSGSPRGRGRGTAGARARSRGPAPLASVVDSSK